MEVIITGATGFIGNALCQEMIEHGYKVTAVVRPESQKKDKLPYGVNIIELSLDRLDELEGNYDLFYHLAWNGASGSDRDNFEIQYSNIQYTAAAIRAAKRCGCNKFVGAGSQAEYGVVNGVCKEDVVVPQPFMMYGAAKLASYHMGRLLAEQLGVAFVWPRIYSVYGVGENEGTLISYVLRTLKEGKAPELSPCENMWDFMYITDCVRALRMLGENNESCGTYNVSAGNPRVLNEYINEISCIICKNNNIKFGAKNVDLTKTYQLEPDISRLNSIGFFTKVSFEQGIHLIYEM